MHEESPEEGDRVRDRVGMSGVEDDDILGMGWESAEKSKVGSVSQLWWTQAQLKKNVLPAGVSSQVKLNATRMCSASECRLSS